MLKVEIKEYLPSENEIYMNKNQIDYFRNYLLSWRQELIKSTEHFAKNLKETPLRKPDPIDQSATRADMALDYKTRNRQQNLIVEIDHALSRIEEGEYGYCEVSGEEIGLKRLLARPIATRCIEVQEEFERMASGTVRYAVQHF